VVQLQQQCSVVVDVSTWLEGVGSCDDDGGG
jgi:hypothetical protein